MKATGGGAFKFADLFKDKLGIILDKVDEMSSLVAGANFLLKVRDYFLKYCIILFTIYDYDLHNCSLNVQCFLSWVHVSPIALPVSCACCNISNNAQNNFSWSTTTR